MGRFEMSEMPDVNLYSGVSVQLFVILDIRYESTVTNPGVVESGLHDPIVL
jgi:hypothetical protein